MRLSVITINYNGSEYTLKLLKSLTDQADNNFEIIVVDNASQEADFSNLKDTVEGAILIRNDQNLGFSMGNNVGIKKALQNGSDWVLLLNNDTWVEEGFISSLRAKLEGLECLPEDRRGMAGLALDEGGHIAYAGKVIWLRPHGYHIHSKEKAELTEDKYIIGGAMIIHKNVFKKIGFLDEKYFLYFEDQDFSLRAKGAGFLLSFFYDVKANHQTSSTTKKLGSPLLMRYHYRNALYFNFKNGPWYVKLVVWPWSWMVILKQLLKIMTNYNREQSASILYGVLDFYKNKMGKIND